MSWVTAYVALGGNLGDPRAAMAHALAMIHADGDNRVVRASSLYRTPPWGNTDQPDFLNAVAQVETRGSPRDLLGLCLRIEADLHRVRDRRWGPRSIDLDILLFGDSSVEEPGLSIPHPRLTQRAFVLVPLAELAPELLIDRRPVTEWLLLADPAGIAVEAGPDWWRPAQPG